MSEQAVSSPAEVVDPFNGEQVSMAEYAKYRHDGTLPERFKPAETAESAPADSTEQPSESESAGDSETPKEQEPSKKPRTAAQRIAQLEAAIEKEWDNDEPDVVRIGQLNATIAKIRGGVERKAEVAPVTPEPKTSQQQPQNYQEWRQSFKPAEWVAEWAKKNPEASYEDATAAMADHLGDVRDHFRAIEQRTQAERQALDAKVNEARDRYEDFDEIKSAFLAKVIGDKGPLIPMPVLEILNESDNLADVLYAIGSDESEADKFVALAKSSPNKAIRYIAQIENLVAEELAKPKEQRGEDGKFTKAPEPKKTTAPKPPSPVSGGSSRAFDVSDDSLSSEEWARKRNEDLHRKR